MESSCVRYTEIPATSNLFGDFLYDYQRVERFYSGHFSDPESFRSAASQIDYPDARRAKLVAALREQNGDSATLNKLAQPGTVAVVTGQQVGLLSGPAYTVYKAITAAKLAQQLTANGIPAVPVFWLATEDHDLAEINHVWLFDEGATPHKVSLSATSGEGGPVGSVPLGEDLREAVDAALGSLPYAAEVADALSRAYCPGATLGSAFKAFLQEILRDLDLLYLDPLAPAIREIATPFLCSAIDALPELIPQLRERKEELEAAGYHAQVNVEPDTALLFLLNGKRAPVRWKDGQFTARDRTFTAAELQDRGAALSPNALLRPVMEDYLLPTVAYVGGPAEIAYMAQAQVLYKRLLGRMPVIYPRTSMTLLDTRAAKLLQKYDLRMTDLLDHQQLVRSRMAAKLVSGDLSNEFERVRDNIASSLQELKANVSKFDATLISALDKGMSKMLYQVDKLAQKTANETLRRDGRAGKDAEYIMNLVYPERRLQERFYSIVPFLAKVGMDLPRQLMEQAHLNCPDHIVRSI